MCFFVYVLYFVWVFMEVRRVEVIIVGVGFMSVGKLIGIFCESSKGFYYGVVFLSL